MTPPQIKSKARLRKMREGKPGLRAVTAPRAIIYVRMSLDRTGEGAGLERQEEACRALALARGWDVVAVIDDTLSATDWRLDDRPGWQNVRKLVESKEADLVVAWHLDRVTRDMGDLEVLINMAIKDGIGLATATGDIDLTTDVGRMVARILAAVAIAEGERKAERQILAVDKRIEKGLPNWIRRPFGYEMDLSLNERESEAVKEAYLAVIHGKKMGEIARDWNAAGFTTSAPEPNPDKPRAPRKNAYSPTGKWTTPAVSRLLRNPRNMGKIALYGEVQGDAAWPEIVDEGVWRQVNELLDQWEGPENAGKQTYLISGIGSCGKCGGKLKTGLNTNRERIYVCGGIPYEPEAGIGHTSIPIEYADGQIVFRLISQMELTGRVTFFPQPTGANIAPLVTRETEIQKTMRELAEDRAEGLIDRDQLRAGTARLREELAEVQAEISRAGAFAGPAKEIDIEAAYEEFDALSLGEQRKVLLDAFEFIRLPGRGKGKPKRGEATWRPEHLLTGFTPAWSPPPLLAPEQDGQPDADCQPEES